MNIQMMKVTCIKKILGIGPFDPEDGSLPEDFDENEYIGKVGELIGQDYGYNRETEEEYRIFIIRFSDNRIGNFTSEEVEKFDWA